MPSPNVWCNASGVITVRIIDPKMPLMSQSLLNAFTFCVQLHSNRELFSSRQTETELRLVFGSIGVFHSNYTPVSLSFPISWHSIWVSLNINWMIINGILMEVIACSHCDGNNGSLAGAPSAPSTPSTPHPFLSCSSASLSSHQSLQSLASQSVVSSQLPHMPSTNRPVIFPPDSQNIPPGCIVCAWCSKVGIKLFTLSTSTGCKAFCRYW